MNVVYAALFVQWMLFVAFAVSVLVNRSFVRRMDAICKAVQDSGARCVANARATSDHAQKVLRLAQAWERVEAEVQRLEVRVGALEGRR